MANDVGSGNGPVFSEEPAPRAPWTRSRAVRLLVAVLAFSLAASGCATYRTVGFGAGGSAGGARAFSEAVSPGDFVRFTWINGRTDYLTVTAVQKDALEGTLYSNGESRRLNRGELKEVAVYDRNLGGTITLSVLGGFFLFSLIFWLALHGGR